MSVTRNYIIVRISKAEKDKKGKTAGGIIIPPAFHFMKYNLQWGRVMEIGSVASENYPEMKIGDTALFHHTIEDGEDRLLNKENNGDELRYLDCTNRNYNYEVYAIIKADGTFVPSRQFVIVNQKIRPVLPPDLSILEEKVDWTQFNEDEYLKKKIDELEMNAQQITEELQPYYDNPGLLQGMPDKEFYRLEGVAKAVVDIRKEMHGLTKYKNTRKLYSTVINDIHEETAGEEGLAKGDRIVLEKDIIYSIEHLGIPYLFANRNFVEWKYAE